MIHFRSICLTDVRRNAQTKHRIRSVHLLLQSSSYYSQKSITCSKNSPKVKELIKMIKCNHHPDAFKCMILRCIFFYYFYFCCSIKQHSICLCNFSNNFSSFSCNTHYNKFFIQLHFQRSENILIFKCIFA